MATNMNKSKIVLTRRVAGWALALMVAFFIAGASITQAAERSLGGIRIFTPVKVILKRFGDPTFITTGANVATFEYGPTQVAVVPPGQIGAGFAPGAGAGTVAGYTGPAMGAGYNAQTDPGENFTAPDISRYYYMMPHGVTYEFVLSPNGRVLSIIVTAYHGNVRTARGITLGSTYAQVVQKYGYPEDHSLDHTGFNDVLTTSYINRDHVAFRFVHNRVASIIVSAAE